jgi:hypothetical protein
MKKYIILFCLLAIVVASIHLCAFSMRMEPLLMNVDEGFTPHIRKTVRPHIRKFERMREAFEDDVLHFFRKRKIF